MTPLKATDLNINMIGLIEKKKRGQALTPGEIDWFIRGTVQGEIPDYQISALLMAIYFRGLDRDETRALTAAMTHSGQVEDFRDLGTIVDKHSTGGVGDKVTLTAAPLMAAAGLKVAKMSGRGLGHTGGTLDKLEALAGFSVDLSPGAFRRQLDAVGLALAGQSDRLVPADRILYALRDVTGTVDSLPLVAASIISKKLALSPDVVIFDVKYGSGSIMGPREKAIELAQVMVDNIAAAGKQGVAFITSMEAPLGRRVGNGLDLAEAYYFLAGRERPRDLEEITLLTVAQALVLAGRAGDLGQGVAKTRELLDSGAGLAKFFQWLKAQGGIFDPEDFPAALPSSPRRLPVTARESGWVAAIDAREIGLCALEAGAGRRVKTDGVDAAAGVYLNKLVGQEVRAGETLAYIYGAKAPGELAGRAAAGFRISPGEVKVQPHVAGLVTGEKGWQSREEAGIGEALKAYQLV